MVHKYGPHIFHTDSREVWDFVNQFVSFNRYTNSPVANYHGKLYNLPFNMNTFYAMWGVTTPDEALAKIEEQKKALKWLLNEMRTCDTWLLPKELMGKIEIDLYANQKLRSQIVSAFINGTALYRIKEGGEVNPSANYKLDDYLYDLTEMLFIQAPGTCPSR